MKTVEGRCSQDTEPKMRQKGTLQKNEQLNCTKVKAPKMVFIKEQLLHLDKLGQARGKMRS